MDMRRLLASVLCAWPLACGDTAPGPAVTVLERDSAGVRIVENAVDTAAVRTGWSIGAQSSIVIGGIEAGETEQLFGVDGGVRLSDGRIVVANQGSAEIKVFGADGELLAVHGRKGEGPGEFQLPMLAGRGVGDSLIVFDSRLRRATVITADSGYARSYLIGEEGGGFPLALGTLADGSVAMGGGMSFSSTEGFPQGRVRPNSRYAIVGPDGVIRGDLGALPAAEMFAEVQGTSFRARAIAFGKVTAAATTSDRIWVGTGEDWEVSWYTPDAVLTGIVRLDRPLQPVTSALHEAWIDEELEDARDQNEARQNRAVLAGMPAADVVAPYQVIRSDRMDNVWVGETLMPGAFARTWTIINRDGRVIGRVTTPPRTLPLEIGEDYILAVTRDELDVESVTLWSLMRPALH